MSAHRQHGRVPRPESEVLYAIGVVLVFIGFGVLLAWRG